VAASSVGGKTQLKTKSLVVRSIPEVTENRARRCQNSWRSSVSHTRIETDDRADGWRQAIRSRSWWLLLLVAGLPSTVCAQNAKDSWSDLNGLRAGQGIEVIESSMKSHSGEFVTVTDELITVKEHGSTVAVKREDVVRVSTGSGPKRGAHAVVGLVAGAGIGAVVGAIAADRSSGSGWFAWKAAPGIGALAGIVIGAPTGAAVGAVLPAHATIYRAAPAAPRAAAAAPAPTPAAAPPQ
jgi:hypothetical protein